MMGRPYQDVSYCHYGMKVQKKTRLWTDGPHFGARDCVRVAAGRWSCNSKHAPATGGKKGVPGQPSGKRASIPKQLIEELYQAYFGTQEPCNNVGGHGP